MKNPSRETVAAIRERFPKGCRVELVKMGDPYRPDLVPGTKGTVTHVDDSGAIHVNWECNSSLSVLYGIDVCRKIDD